MATRIITQICFDATTTSSWAARIAAFGVGLPVHVGLPGPVSRQKLMRISARLGLGPSARFLRKQHGLLWRFLVPGGYHPTRLAQRIGAAVTRTHNNVRGLHIFTFNELAGRRRELLRGARAALLDVGLGGWRRGVTARSARRRELWSFAMRAGRM